jgi:GNAT superfamily N-acetyltransferase
MAAVIRLARDAELPVLQKIQMAAGKAFADIDMAWVATNGPTPLAEFREFRRADRAWVAVDDADIPIAFLLGVLVDGAAHVEQVSVHPDHAGNGIGRDLIEYLADWALARDITAITLTTFVEVPWNGPYYRRCGFRPLADAGLGAELRAIRAEETALGLDEWPRTAMRRDLPPTGLPGQ